MATVYITEFQQGLTPGEFVSPHLNTNFTPQATITSGASSTQSAAFASTTDLVAIFSTAVVKIAFGTNPTALGNSLPIAANVRYTFAVPKGGNYKVAVID